MAYEDFIRFAQQEQKGAEPAPGPLLDPLEAAYQDIQNEKREQNMERSAPVRGLVSGVDTMQALAGGGMALAGKLFGSETLINKGLDVYERNMDEASLNPSAVEFKDLVHDPELGKALEWGGYTLGNLLPSMAEAAGGAIVGSLAAPGPGTVTGGFLGRTILKKGILELTEGLMKKGAKKEIAERVAARAMLKSFGAKAGAVGATWQMEAGGNFAEAVEQVGIEGASVGSALATGAASALLETAGGNIRIIDKVLGAQTGKAVRQALEKGDTHLVARIFKEAATQAPAEMLQESGQEFLSLVNLAVVDPQFKMFSEENAWRLAESGAAGAVGGLAMGAGTGMLPNRRVVPAADSVVEPQAAPAAPLPAPVQKPSGPLSKAVEKGMAAPVAGPAPVLPDASKMISAFDLGLDEGVMGAGIDEALVERYYGKKGVRDYLTGYEQGQQKRPGRDELPVPVAGSGMAPVMPNLSALPKGGFDDLSDVRQEVGGATQEVSAVRGTAVGEGELRGISTESLTSMAEYGAADAPLNIFHGDQDLLRRLGLVYDGEFVDPETGEISTPEMVNTEPLWQERERRGKEARENRKEVGQGEIDEAIERRARSYDRLAEEQEGLGDLGDLDRAKELRAKAAEIRTRKGSIPSTTPLDAKAHEAATSPANDTPEPTPGQIEAGNYKKGHVSLHGLDISIENPRGTQRSGTDPDGKPWSVRMPAHYGYIRRTEGADGDHIDVYVGDQPESTKVFVVDQLDHQTGTFDEHKVILGATNQYEASSLYRAGFSDLKGDQRLGAMTEMDVDRFKEWIRNGDLTRPLGKDVSVKPVVETVKFNFLALQRQARESGLKISKKQPDASYNIIDLEDGSPKYRADNLAAVYDYINGNEPGTSKAPEVVSSVPIVAQQIDSRLNLKATGGKRGGAPIYASGRIDPSIRRTLEAMRTEIAAGEAGDRLHIAGSDGMGGTAEVQGLPSTFPDYFRDKGYTKKATLLAIDRYLSGQGITSGKEGELGGQAALLSDLVREKRSADAGRLAQKRAELIALRREEADFFAVDEQAKAESIADAKELYAHLTDEEASALLREDIFAMAQDDVIDTLEENYADTEGSVGEAAEQVTGRPERDPADAGESVAEEGKGLLTEQTEAGEQVKLFATPPTFGKKAQPGENVATLDFELAEDEAALYPAEKPVAPAAENDKVTQKEGRHATGNQLRKADGRGIAEVRQAIQGVEPDSGTVEAVQQRQSDALRKWAEENDALEDHQAFTDAWNDWAEQYGERVQGTEQQVLLQKNSQIVHKRKFLWPDETWSDYLNRLEAHNRHFPETAYTLLGFTDAPHAKGSVFMARVSQPFSERLRDATEEEIRAYFEAKGFESAEDPKFAKLGIHDFKYLKWRHKETGHLVGDLGPNNVWLNTAGQVAVIDPTVEVAQADQFAGTGKLIAAEVTPKATPVAAGRKPSTAAATDRVTPGPVVDFGEKLGGSRKDRAALQAESAKAFTDDELANLPLSKIWPKETVDAIEDPFIAAFATAARDEVPAKPRTGHKVKRWVEKVKALRDMMADTLALIEDGKKDPSSILADLRKIYTLTDFAAKVELLTSLERKDWPRISKAVEAPAAYSYVDGKKVDSPFVGVTIDGRWHAFHGTKGVAAAVDKVNEILAESGGKKMEFEVRGSGSSYSINKKGDREYRPLKTFDNSKEALAFKREHYDELVQAWELVKARDNVKETDLRGKENKPRTGADHRKGRDVTAEEFSTTFGFRGIEFGNWVSQGKNAKERQGMLNQAYDALMDLAAIINIPPQAVSLNGELGLGFGSRGHGWASAHFEPGTLVINLTKTRGAGSLAHEFFHALDNYFQRQRGTANTREDNYITYNPETYYEHRLGGQRLPASVFENEAGTGRYRFVDKADWIKIEGVRPQVGEAFAELVKALNASPMVKRSRMIDGGKADGYWSRIIERGARAFENYLIAKMAEKGYDNDYLANVVAVEEFARDADRYPYLLKHELAPVEAAFDTLFATIETRETETGIALFSMTDRPSARQQSQRFAEQVERFLSRGLPREQPLVVGHTPRVLQVLGAEDLPVVMTQRTLAKILDGKHHVSAEVVKRLPELLDDPLMVFDSASDGGLVILTDQQTGSSPVVVAVHLSVKEQRYQVNRVASIYGKDRAGWVEEQIEAGRLRYVKNRKVLAEHMTGGLQLPKVSGALQGLSNKRILSQEDLVKFIQKGEASVGIAPLSDVEFDAVFERITARVENPDGFVVVPTARALPPRILAEIEKQGSKPDDIDGVFHGGKVYIVRRHITSVQMLEEILFHELHGHAGLYAMFGNDGDKLKQKMLELYSAVPPGEMLKLAKKNNFSLTVYAKALREAGYDDDTRHAILMEEMLTHLTRAYSRGSVAVKIKEIIGMVRDWLRRNGFAALAQWNDADIAFLLKRARAYAEAGAWAEKGAVVPVNGQEILQRLREAGITEEMLTKLLAGTPRFDEGSVASQMDDETRFFIRDKGKAAGALVKKLTPDTAGLLFETLSGMLPERMKTAVGSVLSNPHYGSKKSKYRGAAYDLALERGANANEIKYEIMAKKEDYEGLEGLRDAWRGMKKAEREMLDKLLVEGDIEGQEYSIEDLNGSNNPLGKQVPLKVQEAYQDFRQTLAQSSLTMFDRLGRLRLLAYEDSAFYQELVDLLDEKLSSDQVARRFGINEKVVEAYQQIRAGKRKLDALTDAYRRQPWYSNLRESLERGMTGLEMQSEFGQSHDLMQAFFEVKKQLGGVEIITGEKFKKAAWYKTLVELLQVGDEHPMLQKLELLNAYKGVQAYDSQLAKLKEEWGQVKGYLPRIRKDGEQHVKVWQVAEDGTFVEVWMQPAKTKFGAEQLRSKVEANLKEYLPHSFDPEARYEVVVEPNTATPEEIFLGIGSHRAIEALLSKVFDSAASAGIIENQLAVQNQVLRILADEISARGFGRHRLSRAAHLIEGYETQNTPAILAQFVGGMAGWLSKSEFAMRANKLMSQIPVDKPHDKSWVREYVDDALKNSTYVDQWFGTARSFAALMYLGFKASSALLNATQNYIWGQAKLSSYTKGATRKLLKAQADVIRDHLLVKAGQAGILTAEERWVLEEGLRRGRSQANYVRAMAGMDDTGGVLGKGQAGIRWLTEKAMMPFQAVETYWNREPALLAAYRVFRGQGMEKEAALKKAEKFVDDVHFVVGKENIPAMLRKMGPIGRTLYTFQSYTHNYLLGMISSLSKGEFGVVVRSLTALVLFGGLAALPFGDDLDKWYRRIFGERPLRMLDKWLRETAGEYTDFGDQIADFVLHGAPALGGVNFSRSIGVNIPWFSPEDDSLAERVTGVWGGMAQKVRFAGLAVAKGDLYRATEYISPEALATILRAYRHYAEGATTMSGRPVFGDDGKQVRYTAKDAAIRSFGFMPLEPSKQTQNRWDARLARDFWTERKSDVLARFRTAKDRKAAMQWVRDFNRELRAAPGGALVPPITIQTLRQALRAKPDRREMAYLRNS
jgi:hypothetical protein